MVNPQHQIASNLISNRAIILYDTFIIENIYYAEKIFIMRRKYLLRGGNIYYAEKTFITRRKYLLRGGNIYYAEEIFITRRKY